MDNLLKTSFQLKMIHPEREYQSEIKISILPVYLLRYSNGRDHPFLKIHAEKE